MSVRTNAPYQDRVEDDGAVLIYEGHDQPKSAAVRNPKVVDQPEFTSAGTLTENGKFDAAAERFKSQGGSPDLVQVYEKIKKGIWTDNGLFHLTDAWKEKVDGRAVFKFRLEAVENVADERAAYDPSPGKTTHSRIVPTAVKLEVWARDKGRCVECGAEDDLHFDHILPYSKGGTSLRSENIQLLCARHNLEKRDRIK